MEGLTDCHQCGTKFKWIRYKNQTIARFCSKSCFYKWNAKNIASFNDQRFQWNKATEKEKEERLKKKYEEKVIKQEGCWDWKGYFDKNGYAQLNGHNGKRHIPFKAHRVSYQIYKGEIPNKMLVLHKCDNTKCTNPEHLWLGTNKDNTQDMIKKNRQKGAK